MIDLKTPVNAVDADGTIIKGKEGTPPSLKEICLYALRQTHQSDQNTGFKQKNERALLARRIEKLDQIELTQGEIDQLKNRIGMLFLQADIVCAAGELLDGNVPSVGCEAPVAVPEVAREENAPTAPAAP